MLDQAAAHAFSDSDDEDGIYNDYMWSFHAPLTVSASVLWRCADGASPRSAGWSTSLQASVLSCSGSSAGLTPAAGMPG